jgi:hypothetical protein
MKTNALRRLALIDAHELNAQIVRRLRAYGGHAASVAGELGVTVERVRLIRDTHGIKIDRSRWPGRAHYSDEIRAAALAEYDRLGTIKGTVRATGIPEGTLRYWIKGAPPS